MEDSKRELVEAERTAEVVLKPKDDTLHTLVGMLEGAELLVSTLSSVFATSDVGCVTVAAVTWVVTNWVTVAVWVITAVFGAFMADLMASTAPDVCSTALVSLIRVDL